ncbi:DNA helicase, phage-associated [Yersinia phage phiR2-01]|uniref:DNA helicase, phage-associated n=1 Tax=Yersinia phage phiR2-01 TaxID=1206557 RepID=I7J3U7_9CAUD|nr:DNA helicase, phage-associated [Yersinia phage phiR2-01]CCI88543.1 DNA helicase, phage-associated [Yersinia phage phiR2-01]
MKVVISNKAYFKPNDELWEYCSKQTTYHIETMTSKFPKMYKNSGVVAKEVKWIPITRLELLDNMDIKYELVDKRTLAPVEIPKPTFTLRPEDQLPIYEECDDTCIINGKPGFGKTILALALAYKLGQKTLVICTNTSIREMWMAEVRKWFGFEPGIIGSGKYNIDPPIVVSNIQTVNKHANTLSKVFGTVIVDEVHHCVATTFTNFLEISCARYKIGLSGTLKRKDGLQVMFKDYFGYTIFSPPVNNTIAPVIHRYQVPVEISGNQNVPWALRANDVYSHPEYRETIINLAHMYCMMGHKVLFVSDRTELIQSTLAALEERGVTTYEIIGATDLDTRIEIQKEVAAGGECVLGAAQSIFSEGISLNELSCLLPGSLINNESLIEQLAGRVQRIVDNKQDPVVVDLALKGGTGMNQASGRMAVYRNNGWKTISMTPEKAVQLAKIAFGNSS